MKLNTLKAPIKPNLKDDRLTNGQKSETSFANPKTEQNNETLGVRVKNRQQLKYRLDCQPPLSLVSQSLFSKEEIDKMRQIIINMSLIRNGNSFVPKNT